MSSAKQSQILVKAYYNDLQENQPEIRRFNLDTSSDQDVYQTLERTISQLNSNYSQGQFTLQYVDEDNDRITFSSNHELQSTLNQISPGGLIKIYVKPKSNSNEQNNTVHVGVTCDGCHGPVIGNRYKCMECHDYDLCQTCSEKNVHADHNMLKLTRPSQHRRCGRGPRFPHHSMRRHCRPFGFAFPWDANRFQGKELIEQIEAHLPECIRTEKVSEILNKLKTDGPIDGTVLLETLRELFSTFSPTKQTEEATTKTTEPKPTVPPTSASTSAPPLGNLFEQLQTTFAPMFQSASAPNGTPPLSNILEQLQTVLAPMTQSTTAPVEDQKKKIDECLERLISMGFVDSNGVLTELIKSKKGDLDQVLDALNPRSYKN